MLLLRLAPLCLQATDGELLLAMAGTSPAAYSLDELFRPAFATPMGSLGLHMSAAGYSTQQASQPHASTSIMGLLRAQHPTRFAGRPTR
jgi:hypothetical protein